MPDDPDGESPDFQRTRERTREAGRSVYQMIHESAVAGLAILVPLLITLLVLNAAVGYVVGVLELLVDILNTTTEFSVDESKLIVRAFVVVLLGAAVLVVGFLTRFRFGELVIDYVDFAIQLIPGVGGVYKSFRQMSDVMVESETKSFRDVKLVEFPQDGSYTMGFLTTKTPEPLGEAAGREDLVTLFLPLAPNPVMGGHLVHIPEDRVYDVDMTVEEGIQTVVTSGVATADPDAGRSGLTREQLRRMNATGVADPFDTGERSASDGSDERPERDEETEHRAEYESYVGPDSPDEESHPDGVSGYRDDGQLGHEADHPSEVARRNGELGREETRPSDVARGDGTIGRDEDRPEAVERDHDEQLGRAEDHPEAVEEDRDTLGDDASTPEDVRDDGESSEEE